MWDTLVTIFSGGLLSGGDATGLVKTISEVWLNVTDYRMWRSLGWLLLGMILIILGFVIWNRRAIGAAAGTIAAALKDLPEFVPA